MCQLRKLLLFRKCPQGHAASQLLTKKICWPGVNTNDPNDCIILENGATKQECLKHIGFPDKIVEGDGGVLMREATGTDEQFECDECQEKGEGKKKNKAEAKAPRETSAEKKKEKARLKAVRKGLKAEGDKEAKEREAAGEGYDLVDEDEADEQLRGGEDDDDDDPDEGLAEKSREEEEYPETSTIEMVKDIVQKGVDRLFSFQDNKDNAGYRF